MAGCGTIPAASKTTGSQSPGGISVSGLASSLTTAGGASWAVVEMGGSAAHANNFWELFVRLAGGTSWKLATPAGVASNGGIVVTASGPDSLLTGFRPSQDLTFSPLAATTDDGLNWSQHNVLDPGLADVPGALASGPGGRLLAITDTGDIETGTAGGASWTRLTTQRALAATAAGRACGITALTAAAWTPAGQPLLAADCRTRRHGRNLYPPCRDVAADRPVAARGPAPRAGERHWPERGGIADYRNPCGWHWPVDGRTRSLVRRQRQHLDNLTGTEHGPGDRGPAIDLVRRGRFGQPGAAGQSCGERRRGHRLARGRLAVAAQAAGRHRDARGNRLRPA